MDEQQPSTSTPQQTPLTQDVNKNLAILAYISLLVIVPLIVSKDDLFVKFHVKQGLVLLVFSMIPWFFSQILWQVYAMLPYSLYLSILGMYGLIRLGFGIATFVFVVMGVKNVLNNKEEPLPLIGGFAKMLKF